MDMGIKGVGKFWGFFPFRLDCFYGTLRDDKFFYYVFCFLSLGMERVDLWIFVG